MFHASSMNRLRFRTKDGFDRAASWLTGSRNESREMISFEYSGQPGADQLSQLRSEAKNEGDQRHPSAWGYGGQLVNSGKSVCSLNRCRRGSPTRRQASSFEKFGPVRSM